MPLDMESIGKRLRRLEHYLNALNLRKSVTWDRYRQDSDLQLIVERLLHLALECVLDIGSHLVSALGLEEPETYGDVMVILGRHGIIPEPLASRLAAAAGFRNVLVHEYIALDPKRVYQALTTGTDDLEVFMQEITAFLRQREADS